MTVALVVCASPVLADTLVASSNCKYSRYYGYEDAKWEAFCKPKFNADAFGVRRASYAVRGCEFGRSE